MGRHDWYRNRTWSAAVEAEFDARIARSRQPWSKWQYFNIQAAMLAHSGFEDVALSLYQRSLVEVTALEPAWRRATLSAIGELLTSAGRIDDAMAALEQAIAACTLEESHLRVSPDEEPENQLKKLRKLKMAGGPSRGR